MKSSSVSDKPSFPTHDMPVNGTYPGGPQSNKHTNFVNFDETDVYKPKFGKDFFYGKIKSPTHGLSQQIKDMVDEAYNANLDSGEITKAPVGASGVNTGSSKNYKSIIAGKEWGEQLMDFLYPGMERRFAFDEDQVAVNPLKLKQLIGSIYSQAEQRGYERAKRELSVKYGGQG